MNLFFPGIYIYVEINTYFPWEAISNINFTYDNF